MNTIASQKLDLLTSLQKHNQELIQILEATNRLTRLRPQFELSLTEIIQIAQQYLGLTIAITLLDETGEILQTTIPTQFQQAWTDILNHPSFTTVYLNQFLASSNHLSQSYYFIPKLAVSQIDWPAGFGEMPIAALLMIPLRSYYHSLIGLLYIVDAGQALSLEATQRLEIFANHVANIIENRSLYIKQTWQIKARETLAEASQQIAIALNLQKSSTAILEATLTVLPQAELAFVYHNSNLRTKSNAIGIDRTGKVIDAPELDERLIQRTIVEKQTSYLPYYVQQDADGQAEGSLIIEPLLLSGVWLGVLVVSSSQPVAFSKDDLWILNMLANQAAIALQNARLYTEARRVDELEALYETGQAINQTLDLQETLTTIMTISCSLTGASMSTIYLYTPEGQRIHPAATLKGEYILSEKDHRRANEIAWQVLTAQKPSLLVEPSDHPQTDDEQYQVQAWLTVPIGTSDSLVGVLELGSDQADTFTQDDVRLMQVIASQAATAIENSRLYEKIQRGLHQTKALNLISQSIIKTLELDHVLELVVQSAAITIPVASHSTLYLFDEDRETFVAKARANNSDLLLPAELETAIMKAIQEAIRKKTTTRLNWSGNPAGLWSSLVAPLQTNDSVIGAISVESPRVNAFLDDDETLLNTFANHASIAIQNANLFRDLSSAYLDLTEKQEEILHNHRILQALFDSITDGLYLVDPDMKIIAINEAEASRLRKLPETLLGKTCDEDIWYEATPTLTQIVRETFNMGVQRNWESQVDIAERGPFTDRDVRTYPIFEVPNQVVQVIIFAQDISEKRRLQASLFRSANLAAIGQLASGIAHQINNPLTVIIANSQIMQMDTPLDSPDYQIIEHIVDAGTQIGQIVQNLLDFSSQEGYDWGTTNLLATIDDALSLITASLARKEISITKQYRPIPTILGSNSRLKLLWMNLLLNARDAISAENRTGTIKISTCLIKPDWVQVQIIDNGIGIPPSHHDRLFHPFFTTKSTSEHLGLGLYTCRAIVTAHQGHIEITSNPQGGGTVVTVSLRKNPDQNKTI